ncbi:hypothetical protein BaRGS_00034169 [Batillaria attramentaria]|uniref:Uncharacterized protein n=1 Tax=Batillaria attramentaria TaxID=370345 RepID=A0ABD0JIM2_9CAEN
MTITWSRAVQLWLLCVLAASQPFLASGACVKGHKSVHFMLPGYVTQPIHVNECRETSMSVITPVVALNSSGLTDFERSFSTCCCGVGNTSLHQSLKRDRKAWQLTLHTILRLGRHSAVKFAIAVVTERYPVEYPGVFNHKRVPCIKSASRSGTLCISGVDNLTDIALRESVTLLELSVPFHPLDSATACSRISETVTSNFKMEKNKDGTFPDGTMGVNHTFDDAADRPDVKQETDYSYFDHLQQQPLTTGEMASFAFLVAFPTFFFIVGVVLMHVYND